MNIKGIINSFNLILSYFIIFLRKSKIPKRHLCQKNLNLK